LKTLTGTADDLFKTTVNGNIDEILPSGGLTEFMEKGVSGELGQVDPTKPTWVDDAVAAKRIEIKNALRTELMDKGFTAGQVNSTLDSVVDAKIIPANVVITTEGTYPTPTSPRLANINQKTINGIGQDVTNSLRGKLRSDFKKIPAAKQSEISKKIADGIGNDVKTSIADDVKVPRGKLINLLSKGRGFWRGLARGFGIAAVSNAVGLAAYNIALPLLTDPITDLHTIQGAEEDITLQDYELERYETYKITVDIVGGFRNSTFSKVIPTDIPEDAVVIQKCDPEELDKTIDKALIHLVPNPADEPKGFEEKLHARITNIYYKKIGISLAGIEDSLGVPEELLMTVGVLHKLGVNANITDTSGCVGRFSIPEESYNCTANVLDEIMTHMGIPDRTELSENELKQIIEAYNGSPKTTEITDLDTGKAYDIYVKWKSTRFNFRPEAAASLAS